MPFGAGAGTATTTRAMRHLQCTAGDCQPEAVLLSRVRFLFWVRVPESAAVNAIFGQLGNWSIDEIVHLDGLTICFRALFVLFWVNIEPRAGGGSRYRGVMGSTLVAKIHQRSGYGCPRPRRPRGHHTTASATSGAVTLALYNQPLCQQTPHTMHWSVNLVGG